MMTPAFMDEFNRRALNGARAYSLARPADAALRTFEPSSSKCWYKFLMATDFFDITDKEKTK